MTDTKPTAFLLSDEPNASPVQVYQCQKRWDELQTSGQEDVRHCDSCKQSVYRVIDVQGFQRAVAHGRCVMIEGRDVVRGAQAIALGKPGSVNYRVTAAEPT